MPLPEGLLAPISDERPGGTEVTYEDDYARIATLRAARRPSTQVTVSELRSLVRECHEEIVEVATQILAEQSKDLTVAIWLSEALLDLEGFEGLDNGLRLILGLIDRFWEHLHPEELEDRAFALEFLGEGFTTRGEKHEPVKLVPITAWGHDLHQFEEWRGVTKDSFGGDDAGAKKKKAGAPEEDPRAPTAANFESGFAETPKARYKELRAQLASCTEAVGTLEAQVKERFKDLKGPKPSFAKLKDVMGRATAAVQSLLDKKLELEPDPVSEGPQEGGSTSATDVDGAGSVAVSGAPRHRHGRGRPQGSLRSRRTPRTRIAASRRRRASSDARTRPTRLRTSSCAACAGESCARAAGRWTCAFWTRRPRSCASA